MMKRRDKISLLKTIYDGHKDYWDARRNAMKNLSDVYNMRFWDDEDERDGYVQVADARNQVESYIASLFSKAPSVVVGNDIKAGTGNDPVAEAVVNRFLSNTAQRITNACRMALIFPCSFLYLLPVSTPDVLDKISVEALAPWDVIVDRTANDWESQRWIGRISQITVDAATELYGDKEYSGHQHIEFFANEAPLRRGKSKQSNVPNEYLFVTIVELWDIVGGTKIVWSPDVSSNEGYLKSSEAVLDDRGRMLIPIIPLYLNTDPSKPLEGTSFLSTIYDQVKEKNLLRTHMQSQVRRDARQYLYPKGAVDEEALALLVTGKDNSFVGVDGDPRQIVPLATIPISGNYDRYNNMIDTDLERANVMASFSRGQSTNVTATEITALAQYTQSEVGKLARIRDTAIEEIARIYLQMLWYMIDDSTDEQPVLIVDGKTRILAASDIEGRFRIAAVDQGSLPIAKAAKQQQLIQLMPMLQGLGVPKDVLLEQIVKVFELDQSLLDAAKDATKAEAVVPAGEAGAIQSPGSQPATPPIPLA